MIIALLAQEAAKLRIDNTPPAFVYSGQGMDNYDMDIVPLWSVNIPLIQERLNFDRFHEVRYNPIVLMCVLSDMNEDAAYYAAKFALLQTQRDNYLKRLDGLKATDGRRLLTVTETPEILTTYIAQTTLFDAPCTAIEFNIPLLLNNYQDLCKPL